MFDKFNCCIQLFTLYFIFLSFKRLFNLILFPYLLPVSRRMLKKIRALCGRPLKSIMDDNVRTTRSVPLPAKVICRRSTQPTRPIARQNTHQNAHQTARRSTRVNSLSLRSSIEPELWCICRQADVGTPMIFCENMQCTIKWFHFNCVNITFAPKGQWFCANCSILRNK